MGLAATVRADEVGCEPTITALLSAPFVYVRLHWPERIRATNRGSGVINASDLLGAPQIAGVAVYPIGWQRRGMAHSAMYANRLSPWIGDKLAGERGAQQRRRDAAASDSTPKYGDCGYLAATGTELALTTTEAAKWGAGRQLGQLVTRVPRGAVAHVELAGGWLHPTLYVLSAPPLRITFTDGTAWAFEVNRFSRRRAKRLVRALQSP